MIRHDNPGKGNHITLFVQAPKFANQQACCGDIREQRMTSASNRGDAIDLMVQGMTPPAQCVVGQGDLLVSNGKMVGGRWLVADCLWPNEFGPTYGNLATRLEEGPEFWVLMGVLLVASRQWV